MAFIRALLSCDDRAVDSIVVGGLLCLLALIFFTGWDEIASRHEFSAMSFAGAVATIIGAAAAAKAGRDRFTPPTPDQPKGQ